MLFTFPASYIFRLSLLQPRRAPVPAHVWVSLSPRGGCTLGVGHTLHLHLANSWWSPLEIYAQPKPSPIPSAAAHHSGQCSVLFLSFCLNWIIHILSSSLPPSPVPGTQELSDRGMKDLVTCLVPVKMQGGRNSSISYSSGIPRFVELQ